MLLAPRPVHGSGVAVEQGWVQNGWSDILSAAASNSSVCQHVPILEPHVEGQRLVAGKNE